MHPVQHITMISRSSFFQEALIFHVHTQMLTQHKIGSSTLYNAPINIMPHHPPYGQKAGNIGALTKGGCPYSRAFDYL